MRYVCAWCSADITPAGSTVAQNAVVSYGICPSCAVILLRARGVPLQTFIDGLGVPILVVDGDFRVRAFNRAGGSALGRTAGDTLEHLYGEVLDCENSHLPEGCGRTVHCSGCAIRRAVVETQRTGKPQMNVPATLRHSNSAAASSLLIHTFRAGDTVVLRVDGL